MAEKKPAHLPWQDRADRKRCPSFCTPSTTAPRGPANIHMTLPSVTPPSLLHRARVSSPAFLTAGQLVESVELHVETAHAVYENPSLSFPALPTTIDVSGGVCCPPWRLKAELSRQIYRRPGMGSRGRRWPAPSRNFVAFPTTSGSVSTLSSRNSPTQTRPPSWYSNIKPTTADGDGDPPQGLPADRNADNALQPSVRKESLPVFLVVELGVPPCRGGTRPSKGCRRLLRRLLFLPDPARLVGLPLPKHVLQHVAGPEILEILRVQPLHWLTLTKE